MMNFINRMLVVLQLLATLALAPILIVLLVLAPKSLGDFLTNLARGFPSGIGLTPTTAICAGLAGVLFFIALLMLFLELQRPSIKRLKVQEVMGGDAEITADAIVHRIEHAVMQIPDVTRTRPRIVSTKKGNVVDLFMEVETDPDVNVPQKTQEVLAAARTVLEEKMGLKVGKIQVRLDHARKSKKQRTTSPDQQQQLKPQKQVDPFESPDQSQKQIDTFESSDQPEKSG